MTTYIYQREEWPRLTFRQQATTSALSEVRLRQGRLMGRMEALGFQQAQDSLLETLTQDVVKSNRIEGENLDADQVRSSVARRLGMDVAGLVPAERKVEGVVEMTLEATRNFESPLTAERLCRWYALLFSADSGAWRTDARGPTQVVSGGYGRERVHFEAPPAERLDVEMAAFLAWVNRAGDLDPVLRAALAHLWFVTIHPFEDGNGRIARAVADWALARSESSSRRCYSMSAQIERERGAYYEVLEGTQKGDLDVTGWMLWFLGCLERAIARSEEGLELVLRKGRFWKSRPGFAFNERQRATLNRVLDGAFEGKITTMKWAKLNKCSHDTAQRDINALVEAGIMAKEAGGRSTSYSLRAS